MKFFKWVITLKIKHLDAEEKCVYLANALIREYEKAGHSATGVTNDTGYLSIFAYEIQDPSKGTIDITAVRGPSVRGKFTVKLKPKEDL